MPQNVNKSKPPTICIIGAGFSGICAAIQLTKQIPTIKFTIFEENADVGGTWFMNTYPGCAPDVVSHLYSFSFEPNPGWSQSYSPQQEVLQYLKDIAKKYELYQKTNFNHTVEHLQWDENVLGWRVTILNKITNEREKQLFDFVITAHGRFHLPKIPEEFKAFQGPMIHSAEWDKKVELNGKTVAIVGSGSSAAQIIPNIAKKVKQLLIYQRHAPWTVPKYQFTFPQIVKWTFRNIPGTRWAFRTYLYGLYQLGAPAFWPGSIGNKVAKLLANFHLWRQIKDPKIREQLRPDYEFGCKRVVPTSDYYPTFNLPNVHLITSKISKVTGDSIVTEDGSEDKVEVGLPVFTYPYITRATHHLKEMTRVLILATGFGVQESYGSIEILGRSGDDLLRAWVDDRPKSYLSVMNSSTPNLFILLGPNTSIGYTSILFPLECQVHWIITLLKEMQENGWRCVVPKKSAEDEYMRDMDDKIKNTIIGSGSCGNCNSWYLNPRGKVTELFPGTTKSFWKNMKTIILTDLELS